VNNGSEKETKNTAVSGKNLAIVLNEIARLLVIRWEWRELS